MVINVRKVCKYSHYHYWKFCVISIHGIYESLYTTSPLWHKDVLTVYCVMYFKLEFCLSTSTSLFSSISSTFFFPSPPFFHRKRQKMSYS